MACRLLMLSPMFTEDTLPACVRPDVAEVYRIIEYEHPDELIALMQEAVKLLAEDLPATSQLKGREPE